MNVDQKILPQAVELEEAVLGACCMMPFAFAKIVDLLTPEMFYREANQYIFSAMKRMHADGETIDILTLTIHLRSRKSERGGTELDRVGGAYYVSCLTDRIASDSNIEFHARIIIQKWIQRRIIEVSSRVSVRCYNEDPDVFDVLDEITDLAILRDKLVSEGSDLANAAQLVAIEMEDYARRVEANKKGRVIGIQTSFVKQTRLNGGWEPGTFIITAARPSMGKTAEILQEAIDAARCGVPVAIFSLETAKLKIAHRLVCAMAEVNNHDYKRGWLNEEQLKKVNAARNELNRLPIFIEDASDLSITTFRSKMRRLKEKHGIQMAIVDYLQLMQGSKNDRRNNNREQEIASISRGIKACAMELNIVIHALSQLSRSIETRQGDKRPQLSDLRESGSLEQDADIVRFIHRPEYYGVHTDADGNSTSGKAEIIIAKNKDGATTTIDAEFIDYCAKFIDPERRAQSFSPTPLTPNMDFQHETNKDPF